MKCNSVLPVRFLNSSPRFGNNVENKDINGYDDPLLKWPMRGLAFTNDIGAAVMDLTPTLGKLLWVPALMYFGADIYDKYKSDETEYSPSSHRALKQAIFQACASVMFPIIVVHNGQKIASLLGRMNGKKNNLSLQLREEIDQYTVDMIKRRSLKKYENNIDAFKDDFDANLTRHLHSHSKDSATKNPLKFIGRLIFGSKHKEKISSATLRNALEYANKNVDEIFEIRRDLIENKKPKKLSKKEFKYFQKTKEEFSADKNSIEGYLESAAKQALKKHQKKHIFSTKLRKTAGGFAALALTIKFIDHFVENYIIKRVVEPQIANFVQRKDMAHFALSQNENIDEYNVVEQESDMQETIEID